MSIISVETCFRVYQVFFKVIQVHYKEEGAKTGGCQDRRVPRQEPCGISQVTVLVPELRPFAAHYCFLFSSMIESSPINISNAVFPQLSNQNCMVNGMKCLLQVEEYC